MIRRMTVRSSLTFFGVHAILQRWSLKLQRIDLLFADLPCPLVFWKIIDYGICKLFLLFRPKYFFENFLFHIGTRTSQLSRYQHRVEFLPLLVLTLVAPVVLPSRRFHL